MQPLPVGSRPISAMQTHLSAAVSFGKCPRARTALRVRAFTLSIAFVEQMTSRIPTSKESRGTNPAQASDHSFTIAGHFRPHASWSSGNRSSAASAFGAVQTGRSALTILSQSWRAA